MDWTKVFGTIKVFLENLTTIFTSTGSKPVGATTSIEKTNSLLSDELAAYGQLCDFQIPTEYHTPYENRRFELETYISSGGTVGYYIFDAFPFDYDGVLGVLYRVKNSPGSNLWYIYNYSTEVYVSISVPVYVTYIEFNGTLTIYGFSVNSSNGAITFYQVSYDEEFNISGTTTMSDFYYGFSSTTGSSLVVDSAGNHEPMFIADKLVFNYVFLPKNIQELSTGWFVGQSDKVFFLDTNCLPTRQIQFNDPNLLGHIPDFDPTYGYPSYYYLDDIYICYEDGRIERYKI